MVGACVQAWRCSAKFTTTNLRSAATDAQVDAIVNRMGVTFAKVFEVELEFGPARD